MAGVEICSINETHYWKTIMSLHYAGVLNIGKQCSKHLHSYCPLAYRDILAVGHYAGCFVHCDKCTVQFCSVN